jgi:hypothetical protein
VTLTVSLVLISSIVGFLAILAIGLTVEIRNLKAFGVCGGTLPIGMEAPRLRAIAVGSGKTIDIPPRPDSVLLLVSPRCAVCHRLLETLAELFSRAGDSGLSSVVVVCVGDASTCRSSLPTISAPALLACDPDGEIPARYGVTQYPMAFVIEDFRLRGYGNPRNGQELGDLWWRVKSRSPVLAPTQQATSEVLL